MKAWLDLHIVPLLAPHALKIHHPFWSGSPPKEVLVLLVAEPEAWGLAAKNLLEGGFKFDFLREKVAIALENGLFQAFGGDGAPLFNQAGMASIRLFRKLDDGVNLILQIGCQYPDGPSAALATKAFYALFNESPLVVCQKFGAVFGQA